MFDVNMLIFHKKYFGFAILLFIIEVLIALYINDNIIRPYFGDILVVILMYCFIKSFLKLAVLKAVSFVLAFSFMVEILQYFKFVELIGLGHSAIARTVMGTTFVWMDFVAYTIGLAIVLLVEKFWMHKNLSRA